MCVCVAGITAVIPPHRRQIQCLSDYSINMKPAEREPAPHSSMLLQASLESDGWTDGCPAAPSTRGDTKQAAVGC